MNYKKITINFLLFLFSFLFLTNFAFANNFIEKKINWNTFKIIKYDLGSSDFVFKIWVNPDWNATNLRNLMERNNWISAVNWIYFCPKDYSECKWKDFTINERYLDWKKIATYDDTWERVVFALDKNNKPFLFQTNKINEDRETEIYNWIANFPLLLKDGKNMIEHFWDVNLIDSKMKAKMSRNFICTDREKKFLYFWYVYNIEMNYLPYALSQIWCYDAINLDAWKSSAFIYNAKYLIWPWRDVLDWLIVERKWLNTLEIRESMQKVMLKIDEYLKNRPIWKKIMILDSLTNALSKAKSKIYEINSEDLYDENWNKIWYEIYANSIDSLKRLYIINYLDKLIYEYKKKMIKDDEDRKNVEEPLF